jgi:hypothetical protein
MIQIKHSRTVKAKMYKSSHVMRVAHLKMALNYHSM